ncbi:hypothetical protein Pint_18024 [Pistacia integerrima]|uniref:Uncharacterized protein n=1 Tax=Pistacia integerrima TaxID=434235 RepID=A0ACC0YYQ2_9ROSI|nr:hypothetical protein Pint_18024 [Pistacia integerrima]
MQNPSSMRWNVLVHQEQQVNLYQDGDLNRKWAAFQDSALLVHLHGEKVRNSALAILRMLAKDIDDEKKFEVPVEA